MISSPTNDSDKPLSFRRDTSEVVQHYRRHVRRTSHLTLALICLVLLVLVMSISIVIFRQPNSRSLQPLLASSFSNNVRQASITLSSPELGTVALFVQKADMQIPIISNDLDSVADLVKLNGVEINHIRPAWTSSQRIQEWLSSLSVSTSPDLVRILRDSGDIRIRAQKGSWSEADQTMRFEEGVSLAISNMLSLHADKLLLRKPWQPSAGEILLDGTATVILGSTRFQARSVSLTMDDGAIAIQGPWCVSQHGTSDMSAPESC